MTPEEKMGYPIKETTRFAVHIHVLHTQEQSAPEIIWLKDNKTLEDAQKAFVKFRDEKEYGASNMSEGIVYDEAHKDIARISYNGRLWRPGPWDSTQKPLAESPGSKIETAPEVPPLGPRSMRYLTSLEAALKAREDGQGLELLSDILLRASSSLESSNALEVYCEKPGTLSLKTLMDSLGFEEPGGAADRLERHNAFVQLDAAQIPAKMRLNETRRTLEGGRLFPAKDFGQGWSVSLQGAATGYACSPKEDFQVLELFETLECIIYGPDQDPVNISDLNLPSHTSEKFSDNGGGLFIGSNLDWNDINEVLIEVELMANIDSRLEPGF